jgi:hypothetical protein
MISNIAGGIIAAAVFVIFLIYASRQKSEALSVS